jgi:dual specificity tyrosine-phosphorylation-regulated kinase 2/3/4
MAAEGTARKKLQKSPPATSMNAERGQLAKSEANDAAHKSNFTSSRRQSSIPNAKAPLGPRPLDIPAGKRFVANAPFQSVPAFAEASPYRSISHSIASQPNLDDGAAAETSEEYSPQQFSINEISRFSFASIIQQNSAPPDDTQEDSLDYGDFLAPINFDDFHNSITTDEPNLSHFPLPGRGPSSAFRPVEENKTLLPQPINPPASTRKVSATGSIGRKNSLARQQNTPSTTLGRNASKSEPMSTGPAISVLRSRRQSHFPPNSYTNANTCAKAPRKSIGPGTFVEPDPSDNKSPRRRPSVGVRKPSNEQKIVTGLNIGMANLGIDTSGNEDPSAMGNTKNPKVKSGQGSKHDTEKTFLTPSRTSDPSRGPGRTKSRSGTPGGTATPSSNATNKRVSVMPPIASGLGARTISPTDARRMRRMSTAPPAPPLPQSYLPHAPPTPQPEPTLARSGSLLRSPGPRHGKSATPSSSRTTPDPNRKSYSSGQSLSSSTSFGSARNSGGMPPLPAGNSTSRFPTPKPQLEPLTTSNGDEVPPVPAIPKAYESPQSEAEQPFFSARSSGLPPADTPISASPHATTFSDAMKAIDIPRALSPSSRKYSYTSQHDHEERQRAQPNTAKKNLPPLRLPPLNLLPLNIPTAAKIKALEVETFDSGKQPQTPPARLDITKTPSTPLTASKATFFSRSHHEHDDLSNHHVRSSTSHHALRAPSTSSIDTPFSFDSGTPGPRIISPFTSSSLPKNSGEFSRYMQPKFNGDLNRVNSQARPSGPRAPSFSIAPKPEQKGTPIQPDSSFSASVLRRKLSRKRSEKDVQESVEKDVDALKYGNMPPPRFPASATMSNLPAISTSPTQRPSYLSSRRKTSSSNFNVPPPAERQGSFSSTQSQSLEGRPSVESNRSFNSHFHQAPRTSAVMNGKPSSAIHTQSPDAGLDRDDMVAEEEMKKLASKRKDFETAARELDALRKRACPRDRISASYALQTTPLNLFERGEIVDFRDVYFTGTRSANKIVGDLNASATNFGYDDDRGDYNIVEGDHLAYRYEVVDLLGKGSFGQVVRCVDHKTGILVAVKIIRNKKRFHQQALVEVNILQKLREWVRNPGRDFQSSLTAF